MVVVWVQCIPIKAYWRFPLPTDYCINYEDGLHVVGFHFSIHMMPLIQTTDSVCSHLVDQWSHKRLY